MTGATLTEFRMPSLGADMESGVLLEWLVHPGDTVHKGDIVAVVDTAKAAVEVECFAGGVVRQLLVQPGARVPVGEVLATIATAEEERSAKRGVVTSPLVRRLAGELHVDVSHLAGTGEGGRVTHADVLRESHPPAPAGRIMASPLARRLATDAGIDLATIRGSGPSGSITAEDIKRSVRDQPAAARPLGVDMDAMRTTIAALMSRSKREIPHYYLTEQIDVGAAMDWLHECNHDLPVSQRLVPAAMLLKAAARAAAEVRELNGFWIGDRFTAGEAVHLGVAISLRGGGLVAPAIHDADKLPLTDLMAALRDLVARTRAGRLRASELSDPTITVSNLGEQGVESILGVIYPPQVALVGFGRIVSRPWAVGGLIGVRPIVTASLAADHRVTDGATGARYLQKIVQLLAQPEEL
jgi:pyruvate dehydrogenase E2 component (dihydrolipoamide acetyltransferase)